MISNIANLVRVHAQNASFLLEIHKREGERLNREFKAEMQDREFRARMADIKDTNDITKHCRVKCESS
jgi:hypothetical protein